MFEVGSGIRGLGPTFGVESRVRGCIPCSGLGPMFEVGSHVRGWVSLVPCSRFGDFDGNLVRGSTESSLVGSWARQQKPRMRFGQLKICKTRGGQYV